MGSLKFSIDLVAPRADLIKLATDYESLPKYLPQQLKEVKILEKNGDEVITNEVFEFKTILRKKIEMQAKHKLLSENKLFTEIITGPAKGSTIVAEYAKTETGTRVDVEINLRLDMKTKFLLPIIKKIYKSFLTGVLYKMNALAIQKS